ncbi:diphosphomevalonate decarboxylase [Wenzhouxiangella marina]|uniref:diphosphomevalonate decarboxylase n=1 Tax=Wenzhouxiangella marina TaxID=1579979 RepID=A0A0K0XX63_9GAMM|nr:diphosphomevalonate decarboxylase [Wenzhouxiangella marina]AKS42270.1 diphosphomevalonate decarboxylase [Wenzhouxiangella marina]MBB6085957.1 diphosphomevalonate decarboxylase [Wenzhouxiangella marina]
MDIQEARARAGSNIALVKYWGKRDEALNLPATGSLSITLDTLHTDTRLVPDPSLAADQFELNGRPADPARLRAFLDRFRALAGREGHFQVISSNSFPTSAGLASSASAFAALAVAANRAFGLDLSPTRLSELARQGSGSAARSIFGGFVEMARGEAPDGSDCVARPLAPAEHWPLEVVVAVTSEEAKSVSSSEGMRRTMRTSPYYPAWVEQVDRDLALARESILSRDFAALADVAEASALAMHASALAARPGVIYFKPATLACLERVRELRASGLDVFFTVDAGPQVKAICRPEHRRPVADALAELPGVHRVLEARLGPGAVELP